MMTHADLRRLALLSPAVRELAEEIGQFQKQA